MPKESAETIPSNSVSVQSIELDVQPKNKVDDEVMGLINDSIENDSLLRRDSVLAFLEFKVDTLIMSLFHTSSAAANHQIEIAKFKFDQSNFKLEALPRYESFLFQMSLGSFYLIDNVAESTSFNSILIYPKDSDKNSQKSEVFSLVYEYQPLINLQKPTGLKYKANLSIKSCGLDIILNLSVIENLNKFFSNSSRHFQESNSVLFNTGKALKRAKKYQPVYSSSKAQILSTNFNFEITSPKLIMPQNFKSKNPYVIILDFGRLIFENMNMLRELVPLEPSPPHISTPVFNLNDKDFNLSHNNGVNDDDEDDDDDDEFHTPSATPPNEIDETFSLLQTTASTSSGSRRTSNSNEFNYNLYLNNLQVISGKLLTDNLNAYINKGHSSFHLLEKFDIKIQIQIPENQRLTFTVNMDLLKLNIDDIKLIHSYKTIQNLQNFF
jgi:vacuolar protein sorting-associated protein 13D